MIPTDIYCKGIDVKKCLFVGKEVCNRLKKYKSSFRVIVTILIFKRLNILSHILKICKYRLIFISFFIMNFAKPTQEVAWSLINIGKKGNDK